MRNRRSTVLFPVLMLALAAAGVTPGFAQSSDKTVPVARTRRAGPRPVPARFIITAQRLSDAGQPESVRLGRSRFLPAFDAYGTPRAPGEPRLATGSFIPQKFELYGNAANTATPLFIYTQGDLRSGGSGGFLGGPFGQSYSGQQSRLTVPRYALDLHRIPPGKRMAVLTQLIGPERAQQAMDEAYAAATITR